MAAHPKSSKTESAQQSQYPLIEKVIETEDFGEYSTSFNENYEALERLTSQKNLGVSKQNKARKIMKAYDLTVDLIRELLALKQDMVQKQAGSEAEEKKSPKKQLSREQNR